MNVTNLDFVLLDFVLIKAWVLEDENVSFAGLKHIVVLPGNKKVTFINEQPCCVFFNVFFFSVHSFCVSYHHVNTVELQEY